MRKFYLAYRDAEKLQPLAGEIGWTHNQVILDRCGDDLEREFYLLRMTRRMGWTRRVLAHQIANRTYEKPVVALMVRVSVTVRAGRFLTLLEVDTPPTPGAGASPRPRARSRSTPRRSALPAPPAPFPAPRPLRA